MKFDSHKHEDDDDDHEHAVHHRRKSSIMSRASVHFEQTIKKVISVNSVDHEKFFSNDELRSDHESFRTDSSDTINEVI